MCVSTHEYHLMLGKNLISQLEITEKSCYYPPPPTESRRLLEITEKSCYYPPPTESRRKFNNLNLAALRLTCNCCHNRIHCNTNYNTINLSCTIQGTYSTIAIVKQMNILETRSGIGIDTNCRQKVMKIYRLARQTG